MKPKQSFAPQNGAGDTNEALTEAVKQLGGYEATGRLCGISGKAVMKWTRRGRLPRTEWTGETHYAETIAAATGIAREALRPDPCHESCTP